jgi:hypothetical protein
MVGFPGTTARGGSTARPEDRVVVPTLAREATQLAVLQSLCVHRLLKRRRDQKELVGKV